jgi:CheY-like chemotaxis protein
LCGDQLVSSCLSGCFSKPQYIEFNLCWTALKDPKIRAASYQAILERSSAEAAVVSSGQEALAAIKSFHPDVLICDLAMSEMDGYELLENVRRLEPELGQMPVIAFTAAASNEDQARTRRAGFQAHLAKPIDPNKLITTILQLAREHTR